MPDSDDRAVEVMARALFDGLEKHGEWDELALQGGRIYFTGSVPQDALASFLLDAYLKHCKDTLESAEFVERKRN